jgi:cellulose synthase/poly-beta-1,6-N-acetylglucosamine synthase-like glycosyltransferase
MSATIVRIVSTIELGVLAYFVTLQTLYLLCLFIAAVFLRGLSRKATRQDLEMVLASPATPGISILVPAHNEARTIVETVRSLLQLSYPRFEIVVINDGSKDDTLEVLVDRFGLSPGPSAATGPLPSQPVRGIYRSAVADLAVVDKINGGRSDALNAGINVAAHAIVCTIDADSILEPDALARIALPFIEDTTTIAVGGTVCIANGCAVESGSIVGVRLPRTPLPVFQAAEYLRAFIAGRIAQAAANALLIISGAFGAFRRDVLVAAGGFSTRTIGEDMEMVIRLHRRYRESGEAYRIVSRPDAVCWTEAPDSLAVLRAQRNRWQRGTLQVLRTHARMIGNPRYGAVGLLALPFHLVFEALSPLVELSGYVVAIVAFAGGWLNWSTAGLFVVTAVVYGAVVSVAGVLLEELTFRRYPRTSDLALLVVAAVVENLGYRQLTLVWRVRGIIAFFRGQQDWGPMSRKGFAHA